MKKINLLIVAYFVIILSISACTDDKNSLNNEVESYEVMPGTRNPNKWPFAQSSIWNIPIGSKAKYIHAWIEQANSWGMTIDENIIVLEDQAPNTEIYENNAGWDRSKDRCSKDGGLLFSAPIPENFVVSPDNWDGLTPNAGLAVLMPDGRTIKQTQPFARCEAGKFAASKYLFEDVDLYGPGIYGAHGGSKLSAIGGTLRVGELRPDSGPIHHALKIVIYAAKNLYYDEVTKGYRWPAKAADSYAAGNYGSLRTKPVVKECRMGALLALPADWDLDTMGFETKPARILAKAFQNYGAYVVDDTAWDVYGIATEWGPDGRFAEQFQKDWGFSINPADKNTPWSRDMDRIFLNLHVVDNNSAGSKGGGGKPLMPLAPEFDDI